MKIPNIPVVKEVADFYHFKTLGRLKKWLSMLPKPAPVFYYKEGKLLNTRAGKLLKELE